MNKPVDTTCILMRPEPHKRCPCCGIDVVGEMQASSIRAFIDERLADLEAALKVIARFPFPSVEVRKTAARARGISVISVRSERPEAPTTILHREGLIHFGLRGKGAAARLLARTKKSCRCGLVAGLVGVLHRRSHISLTLPCKVLIQVVGLPLCVATRYPIQRSRGS